MIEALRSLVGRVAAALALSALLVLVTLLVEPGMIAITPALIIMIWIGVVGTEQLDAHRSLLRWLLALGVATFVAGVVAFVIAT